LSTAGRRVASFDHDAGRRWTTRQAERMTSSSMWAELPSTTDKIARLACSFLTNRVPETNFPLKNLD
jgi:hypothetical protein